MSCPKCGSEQVKRFGKNRNGSQRYRCVACNKTWTMGPPDPRPLGPMRIPLSKAVDALRLLLDGMSIRGVERFTRLNRDTLCDLILSVGERCKAFLSERLRGIPVADVQVDEVWAFVGMKERTKYQQKRTDYTCGDAYSYVGIERHTKLIVGCLLGKRDHDETYEFIDLIQRNTSGRFQLTSDGWKHYRRAVLTTFNRPVDFGQLLKTFKNEPRTDSKYSPSQIIGIKKRLVCGNPIESRVCTSHIERSNLTLRMTCRRWTRLTNAFSKSWKHHEAALALYVAFYNFCRPHETLEGSTPAVAARLADHRWTVEELLTATAA